MLHIPKMQHTEFKRLVGIKTSPGSIEQELWKKVYSYIPPLRYIPGILMIGVGNSLSMNACHKDSDIDVFVITKKNRLWTVRIVCTLYFSFLKLRKNTLKHKGCFCLSFFVTNKKTALNFEKIAIKHDIYLYFWILYMKPIINKNKTYETFININTKWCDYTDYKDIQKNALSYISHSELTQNASFKFLTSFGNICEKMLKTLFLHKSKKNFIKKGSPFGVIISDDMLKFHDQDTRKKIRSKIIKEN